MQIDSWMVYPENCAVHLLAIKGYAEFRDMRFQLKRLSAFLAITLAAVNSWQAFASSAAERSPEEITAEGLEFFEKRIRPVLVEQCYVCHSVESAEPQADLFLDSRQGLLRGGTRGPAIDREQPDRSLLLRALLYNEKDLKMPPMGKLSAEEIADFRTWLRMGAPDPRDEPALAPVPAHEPEFNFEEERRFWSFQPVKSYAAPEVRNRQWPRNDVDRFILARLEGRGLEPAPPADKRTLLRRVYFDLIGLPPSPEEVEEFLADESPEGFEKVVERLLASPHYGERWGRHWLDLVRYADTAGDSSDYPVPQIYLYRNYVIDSFNRDKSYDQFLREQIAGDLLPAANEEERWEKTIATGYLAIARRFSVRPERQTHLTIEDTLDNLGKTVLGLTLGCARCHDHKYDPIPAEDYYALYGIFASTRYPFAGSENDQEQKDLVYRQPAAEVAAVLRPYEERLSPLDANIAELREELRTIFQSGEGATIVPVGGRSLEDIRKEIREFQKQRRSILAEVPSLEKAFAVAEGKPGNARVQRRGEPRNLAEEVPRRFLQVLGGQTLPEDSPSSGRLQLAEWLTDPRNPLTARVIVNRIWQHHFGKGLVGTPSDFGRRGKPPAHPELLDYLARRFIESGWSFKALHRLIMLSRTYQQSSAAPAATALADPENELLGRFDRRRLDAESLRDALLHISGELDLSPGGAHPFPPEHAWKYTQHEPFTGVYETKKRSVYLMVQRFQKHPYLSLFDGADPNATTPERPATTTPLQALFLMNSPFVHAQSAKLAARLVRDIPEERARIVRAYRLILSRPPDSEELAKSEAWLDEVRRKLNPAGGPEAERETKALAALPRVLFATSEFLYLE
jgi:hypothetical protein